MGWGEKEATLSEVVEGSLWISLPSLTSVGLE